MLLDCQHTWPSHFAHHPVPPHTPAKEQLTLSCIYPLVKDLHAPNVVHHLIIYCSHREHFTHHCNAATPGIRGREQVLHKGSKHKVLNIMFLISFGQRFSKSKEIYKENDAEF